MKYVKHDHKSKTIYAMNFTAIELALVYGSNKYVYFPKQRKKFKIIQTFSED